jgi:hypothetical protein
MWWVQFLQRVVGSVSDQPLYVASVFSPNYNVPQQPFEILLLVIKLHACVILYSVHPLNVSFLFCSVSDLVTCVSVHELGGKRK